MKKLFVIVAVMMQFATEAMLLNDHDIPRGNPIGYRRVIDQRESFSLYFDGRNAVLTVKDPGQTQEMANVVEFDGFRIKILGGMSLSGINQLIQMKAPINLPFIDRLTISNGGENEEKYYLENLTEIIFEVNGKALASLEVIDKLPQFNQQHSLFFTLVDAFYKVNILSSIFQDLRGQLIHIPSNVNKICASAFQNCAWLTKVIFEPLCSLKDIENRAFYRTNLQSINIPASIKDIKTGCFAFCEKLHEVTFEKGSNLKQIGDCAFKQSGLKSICIPSKVEFIGYDCFNLCKNLEEVTFESYYNLKRMGYATFMGSSLKSIHIPAELEFIYANCFLGCESLEEVTFESNSVLRVIGDSSFRNSNLKSIHIPSKVETLLNSCFLGCKNLEEVIFEPNSNLKYIEEMAFAKTGLRSIIIPREVESIGRWCFSFCLKLENVILEGDPKTTEDTFEDCESDDNDSSE
ncbi:MAG: leucine-rich repeat domain-containing protein [Holosporaceae bacterium]|nr:leucine-rich repeat domain-containing protein [Holosporaceae bacterium]